MVCQLPGLTHYLVSSSDVTRWHSHTHSLTQPQHSHCQTISDKSSYDKGVFDITVLNSYSKYMPFTTNKLASFYHSHSHTHSLACSHTLAHSLSTDYYINKKSYTKARLVWKKDIAGQAISLTGSTYMLVPKVGCIVITGNLGLETKI